MISIPHNARCLIRIPSTDFRCGIDGLVRLVRGWTNEDPFSGSLFLFTNRNRTGVKILYYDGQGFWHMHKRFSEWRLKWWPKSGSPESSSTLLTAREVQVLLWNGDPTQSNFAGDWRKVA